MYNQAKQLRCEGPRYPPRQMGECWFLSAKNVPYHGASLNVERSARPRGRLTTTEGQARSAQHAQPDPECLRQNFRRQRHHIPGNIRSWGHHLLVSLETTLWCSGLGGKSNVKRTGCGQVRRICGRMIRPIAMDLKQRCQQIGEAETSPRALTGAQLRRPEVSKTQRC